MVSLIYDSMRMKNVASLSTSYGGKTRLTMIRMVATQIRNILDYCHSSLQVSVTSLFCARLCPHLLMMKRLMTFSWISFSQNITHLSFSIMRIRPVRVVETKVCDFSLALQPAVEKPAMEPQHLSEKNDIRSVNTDHRAWVWQIFDPGVGRLSFLKCGSNKLRHTHKKDFRLSRDRVQSESFE